MLVVAVDTSGRNGSVALCRGDSDGFDVLQRSTLEGGTYSERLLPEIAELLVRAKVGKTQLDGLIVVDGPGSFTGLRVGLSTVKAFCEALHKPLAAVSMLEALAVVHGREGEVSTTVLDAGRGEIYLGEYQVGAEKAWALRESIVKLQEFVANAPTTESRVVTPIPKIAEALAGAGFEVELVSAPMADDIGRIGLRKLLAGETADVATLDANYMRRPDAELFSPSRR